MWALAVSPEGKTVASGGVCDRVYVWDLATGKEIRALEGHQGDVSVLAYSPDGQTLISGSSDQTVRFWKVATGKELRQWRVGHIDALALSPDGKTLAVAVSEGWIRLYEVDTGKEIRRLPGHQVRLNEVDATGKLQPGSEYVGNTAGVTFSPDGRSLASVGGMLDCTLRLWDVTTGKERLRRRAHEGKEDHDWVQSEIGKCKKGGKWVTFSPDGKVLASAGSDDKIILWDAATGKEIGRFEGHTDSVFCVAFSPDGKTLASASADKSVLLWDATLRLPDGRLPPVRLAPKEVEAHWNDLAAPQVLCASRAFWTLVAAPAQTVPFLQERVRPVPAPDARRVARLIADLDHDRFPVREKATHELVALGKVVKPALWDALDKQPPVEARSRIEQVLQKLAEAPITPEQLRELRAVGVLENIPSAEARQLLDRLAQGAPGAPLTGEAQAARQRQSRREAAPP